MNQPNCSDKTVMKTMQLNDQKAGMQGLDKEVINKIIFEASKGTPYFAFQEKRQKSIDAKVQELQSALKKVTDAEYSSHLSKMEALEITLEADRDLSHSIVHIDMDAFYAAVESEANPKLKDVPMAVGSSSMLSTSNYLARKYGVRAAMPGFIAKKLCPNLTIVPCDFAKYRQVSQVVRGIVQEYDPDYCPASLDEMYLDLTKYIQKKVQSRAISRDERDKMACEIVEEIREKIRVATNLTASAGIAPNVMLAKVGSDQNKPNGQYQIASTREAVMAFVADLPVKKISGIGPVQAQILNALGIHTCSDMYAQRAVVAALFKPSTAEFYVRAALGIASTTVKSDYVRKSIGVEQTFKEIHDKEELHQKCQELCEEAVEDMRHKNMVGKVVVLKLKTTDFKSQTRNHSLPVHTGDLQVVSRVAKRLLDAEMDALTPRPLKLRLMGIRLANLVYEDEIAKEPNIKSFLKPKQTDQTTSNPMPSKYSNQQTQATAVSEPQSSSSSNPQCSNQQIQVTAVSDPQSSSGGGHFYTCPICGGDQRVKDLDEFNAHIDACLNRSAIKEMLSTDWKESKRKRLTEDQNHKVKKTKLLHAADKTIKDYFC